MKLLTNILMSLLLIGAAVGFLLFLGAKEKRKKPSVKKSVAIRVDSIVPVKSDSQVALDLWGEVKYKRVIELRSEIEGRVLSILPNLRPGYSVKEGAVLVTLDSARLLKRKAEIEASISRIKAEVSQYQVEESTINAELKLAEKNVKLAQADVDRHLKLVENKSVSPVTLNTFNKELLRSQTAAQQLKSRLDLLPQRKLASEASLRGQKSSLELLEEDIADATIKSPFNGVLLDPIINVGDYVRKGDVVCRIYDPADFEVWVPIGVSEKEKLGAVVGIEYEDSTIGEYRFLGMADKELQSDTLIFNLTKVKLKSGELIKVKILGQTLSGVYIFPAEALRDDKKSLYAIVDAKLKVKPVKVLLTHHGKTFVQAKFGDEERVVIQRMRDAAEGTAVQMPNTVKSKKKGSEDSK